MQCYAIILQTATPKRKLDRMANGKAPNGYGTCPNCKYLDARAASAITGAVGVCRRFPPDSKETADPSTMIVLGMPAATLPDMLQVVAPLVSAIVVAPDGSVRRVGLGRAWPPVIATDYCGEFSAGRPRE